MKKSLLILSFILLNIALTTDNYSQGFGQWICAYATIDDQPNATGNRTISVAAYGENDFVALVYRNDANTNFYIVPYKDADSLNGRLGFYTYGGTGQYTLWLNGFDQVFMDKAMDLEHFFYNDKNLIFVTNNDAEHNILVFEMTADSFNTHPMRLATGADSIWAIDIDAEGHVFVTTQGDALSPSKVLVYDSPANDASWEGNHTTNPLHVITLPENGDARGVTVNPEGTVIYVSNFLTKKVYCYVGDVTNGYSIYNDFSFEVTDFVTDGATTIYAGAWGLNFLPGNNLLFVGAADDFENNTLGYSIGKVYILNPNDGSVLGTIDNAEWNYQQTGAYNNNGPGNVSGYASPYNLDFDDLNNVYCVSYYGWTIDKWYYTTDLPTLELTIVSSVEKIDGMIPGEFTLMQNYPNPFNPATNIQFSITESSEVTLGVYSVNGELVSELITNEFLTPGNYTVKFNAARLSSGNYIYSLKAGNKMLNKIMTLIK